jgi:glycerophosphoryl diester phosphodiesterase
MNFRFLISILIIASFLSCNKAEVNDIKNLNGGIISVIGHGGGGFQSPLNKEPENSLSSIIKAIEVYNADGVELDVQLSKDLNLILYHDDKLETSTNGNGFIYEYNLNELVKFKYDRDFYANILLSEYIIALETVLERFIQRNIKPQLHLDLRPWLFDESLYNTSEFNTTYIDKIVETITKYNYQNYTYIASGNIELLEELNTKNSQIKLMVETSDVRWAAEIINKNDWYGIVSENDKISKVDVDYAHSKNVRVALFSVKIQSDIVNAVNKHPDYILTDNILKLQQILYK